MKYIVYLLLGVALGRISEGIADILDVGRIGEWIIFLFLTILITLLTQGVTL